MKSAILRSKRTPCSPDLRAIDTTASESRCIGGDGRVDPFTRDIKARNVKWLIVAMPSRVQPRDVRGTSAHIDNAEPPNWKIRTTASTRNALKRG
jgi:hypothetical protein